MNLKFVYDTAIELTKTDMSVLPIFVRDKAPTNLYPVKLQDSTILTSQIEMKV